MNTGSPGGIAEDIIGAVEKGERSALEAVRKFVDTVDESVPAAATGSDGTTRRRPIIDSAFEMVEKLLNVSNDFARSVVKVTEEALDDATPAAPAAKKPSGAGAKKS